MIDWLDAHGAELEVDRARLCIGGDSAGANLSVAACLTLRERGAAPLAGMVLNYGVYDANLFRDSTVKYGGGEYLLSTQQMVWFYWNYLRAGDDPRDPRISPVHADLRGLPPAFMAITELDLLHDTNQDMAARLREAGVDVQAKVYPGTVHSFLEAVSLAQVSVAAFDDTAAWLRAVLRPDAAAAAIHTGNTNHELPTHLGTLRALLLASAAIATLAGAPAQAQTRGGTLRAIVHPEPPILITAINSQSPTQFVGGKIFQGLLTYDADLKPQPSLARAWRISPDGLVYTFELQPDVKWHDGKPFSADDVVFSIDKLVREVHPRTKLILNAYVESVRAVDPATVEIRLKEPFAPSSRCSRPAPCP